jgi:hypothetical protein
MSAIDVRIPETKWSMIEWHSIKENPKKDERILMEANGVVLGGRYLDDRFVCAHGEVYKKDIRLWSSWPTAPKW